MNRNIPYILDFHSRSAMFCLLKEESAALSGVRRFWGCGLASGNLSSVVVETGLQEGKMTERMVRNSTGVSMALWVRSGAVQSASTCSPLLWCSD